MSPLNQNSPQIELTHAATAAAVAGHKGTQVAVHEDLLRVKFQGAIYDEVGPCGLCTLFCTWTMCGKALKPAAGGVGRDGKHAAKHCELLKNATVPNEDEPHTNSLSAFKASTGHP